MLPWDIFDTWIVNRIKVINLLLENVCFWPYPEVPLNVISHFLQYFWIFYISNNRPFRTVLVEICFLAVVSIPLLETAATECLELFEVLEFIPVLMCLPLKEQRLHNIVTRILAHTCSHWIGVRLQQRLVLIHVSISVRWKDRLYLFLDQAKY